MVVLKAVDYDWTAWDSYQSLKVIHDPNASEADKAAATANLALTAAFEAAEPDDLLPVALPLDDLAQKGILRVGQKVGERAAKQALEESGAAIAKKPPIVIGENMANRVRPYAQRIGAQTINDFIPPEHWTMQANEAWIKQMRAEGREIIDIGPDFERRLERVRRGVRPDAPAYNLERETLQGYQKYRKVFERSGKYWGSVSDLD